MNSIQLHLQQIQKSSDGLKLAELFLSNPIQYSKNCQFFGALTYTVLINGDSVKEDEVLQLVGIQVQSILTQLQSTELKGNMFIIRKLLSNISLLFIKFSNVFQNPLQGLLFALLGRETNIDESTFQSVNDELLALLINFSSIIVEDICKLESSSEIHERIISGQTFNITEMLFKYLSQSRNLLLSIPSLECMTSWVTYTSLAEDKSTVRYSNFTTESSASAETISPINAYLFHFLSMVNSDEDVEIVNKAILVATEILEINPRLFNSETRSLLKVKLFGPNDFGSSYILSLTSNGFAEEMCTLVSLFVTFLRNDILHLAKTFTSLESQHILRMLVELTGFPGIPIEEENVLDILLSFWEELANVFIDDEEIFIAMYAEDVSLKLEFESKRNSLFQDVSSLYWNKIHIPRDESVFQLIRAEFLHYRSNVSDLFIVTYSLLKEPFFNLLVTNVVTQLQQNQNANDLESSIYLLYKVTDDCSYLDSQANLLLKYIPPIFSAGLIPVVSNYNPDAGAVNYFVYSTTINFLSSIQFYFKSDLGTNSLSEVFDLLFRILLSGGSSGLSLHASKTILKICQECREKLVDFLPNLEQLLAQMLRNQELDNVIRQRMVNSYTSIGRCIREERRFGNIVKGELNEIQSLTLEAIKKGDDESDYIVSLLTCVSEIGKGCQIPEEVDDFFTKDQEQLIEDYWKEDPLSIQPLILSLIKEFSLSEFTGNGNSSIITEKCCSILKSGLGEPVKGAFVFDMPVILNYVVLKFEQSISKVPVEVTSITHLYSLLESLVIVNSTHLTSEEINEVIDKIFISHINVFQNDPDMIHSCINLFATILEKKPSLLINSPSFATIVMEFAMKSLLAKELIVIKTSLKFWLTLLTLKKGTQQDQQEIQKLMISSPYGQIFVYNLIQSFIDSPRSHLDYYYQVFRNLISKYPQYFKNWMKSTFEELKSKGGKGIDVKVYETFISKLVLTRGMRTANDVCKSFWLEVNGLIEFNTKRF